MKGVVWVRWVTSRGFHVFAYWGIEAIVVFYPDIQYERGCTVLGDRGHPVAHVINFGRVMT
jgi:hypothetical protein